MIQSKFKGKNEFYDGWLFGYFGQTAYEEIRDRMQKDEAYLTGYLTAVESRPIPEVVFREELKLGNVIACGE